MDDRKNEFINNNLSLSEANCEYKGYDINIKQAECSCEFKTSIAIMSYFQINKDLLLQKFKDIKNSMNLLVIKCYFVFFTYDGLINNYGSYILIIIILIEIFCLIYFLIKGYNFLIIITKNERLKEENKRK